MIGYVQFVALNIAIGYSHNACISFNIEFQFVVGIGYTATFAIYGDDAHMLQILAISLIDTFGQYVGIKDDWFQLVQKLVAQEGILVLAICLPVGVIGNGLQLNSLTSGFDSMAGYHLTVFVGHGF